MTVVFWLVFALVFLMAATGARRSDAKAAVCVLLLVLAGVGLIT